METQSAIAPPETGLLYRRVCRAISEDIEKGVFKPGERLPSERELCENLRVSRATLRRALKQLASDGLVESIAGRGTFVASGPLSEAPNTLMSLTDVGTSRGLVASARVLNASVAAASLDEAESFGIAPGAEIFCLERVRYLDGQAISVDLNRIPLGHAPRLADVDFETASLYATLEEAGAGPIRAEYALAAVSATTRYASLLEIEIGAPLLQATTRSFDQARRLVELGEQYYRGDRYRFRTTLTKRRW